MKLFKNTLAALAITAFGVSAMPSRSEASIIASVITLGGVSPAVNCGSWACLIMFPVMMLDQKTSTQNAVSAQDLKMNGYSDAEISAIEADQKDLAARLSQANLAIKVNKGETLSDIQTQVRSIKPDVSADYLNFLSDSLNLKN